MCVCKSAKGGALYEEVRKGPGKSRRKRRRRRRKVIKALYGDGQASPSCVLHTVHGLIKHAKFEKKYL